MSTSGRVPFSCGSDVDWFRSARCDECVFDEPEGGGCDAFMFGDADNDGVPMGGWPSLLVETDAPGNPLGVECARFTAGEHGSRYDDAPAGVQVPSCAHGRLLIGSCADCGRDVTVDG